VTINSEKDPKIENKGFLSMLGIAKKAGRLVTSTPMVCDSLKKKRKPFLVIVSGDASDSTKKKLITKSDYYKVKVIVSDVSKEELSHSIGKESIIASVAVTDENFATELLKLSGKEGSDISGSAE
jgi:ribosomal protein L7Ae-like RNA K-turn-binding protein